jgi:hypothetical protein
MEKVGALSLIYRDKGDIDATQVAPPINGSYREFSKPFYRSVGIAPDKGTAATTSRINDTIDGSVFDRWRADASYRRKTCALGADEAGRSRHALRRRPGYRTQGRRAVTITLTSAHEIERRRSW